MRATTIMPLVFVQILCDVQGYVAVDKVDDNIAHLRDLSGDATLGHQEGGGWCYRYSCSYESGIYGCNDNQYDVNVSWSTLADYAQNVKDNCTKELEDGKAHWKVIQGQAFDSDGWNVIVGLKDGTYC
ncbi:hypothetical protein SLS53_001156 [Cytospora paraplurivora]|uniref:Uncharacterized protein n=1 Tax=Cytospora paraplurivora TaxID=2898453 RepID=A0AAN9YMA7_9PEZI